MMLVFRLSSQGRQVDDIEIWTHTNDTLGSVRRQIMQRLKANPASAKLELFLNGDVIDTVDDRKILLHLPLRDKTLLNGKLTQINGNQASHSHIRHNKSLFEIFKREGKRFIGHFF